MYPKGTKVEGYAFTEEEMIQRFKDLGATILTEDKLDKAADLIMHLEDLDDLDELFRTISL